MSKALDKAGLAGEFTYDRFQRRMDASVAAGAAPERDVTSAIRT